MTVLLALLLVLVLFNIALINMPACLYCVFGFLIVLGELRRFVDVHWGFSSKDPLLLVTPVVVIGLLLLPRGGAKERIHAGTRLGKTMLFLTAVMGVEVFNPLQGGMLVGLGGAFFYCVPMAMYWVGRWQGSQSVALGVVRRVVIPLAFIAAVLGLFQAIVGPLPFELAWAKLLPRGAYTSIYVNGRLRPLSLFTSGPEYCTYLCIAIVAVWAEARANQRLLSISIPAILLLGIALFLGSVRTELLLVVITLPVLWSLEARAVIGRLGRLMVAGTCAIVLLMTSLSSAASVVSDPNLTPLIIHEVGGLTHPLDDHVSTGRTHISMLLGGFQGVLDHPLGVGLGATTAAAAKFGSVTCSTDVDLSDTFVSLGLVGGLAYAFVIVESLRESLAVWERRRSEISLITFGVLLVTIGRWLVGGHYAVAGLTWFLIGSCDREYQIEQRS